MLKKLTPNLIVDNVQETIDFYQNMLGCFELISRDPVKGDLDWALMRCEDVEIMFQSKKSLKDFIPDFMNENRGGNIIIYIEIDNIDSFYDWVKQRVTIVRKLHPTPYQAKEFLIRDCNGFIITFAEL
ncbi:MAG: VOC family protein [Actinomycetia bacterium]|nr:VOC family protein [Actinomycetes bacterium]